MDTCASQGHALFEVFKIGGSEDINKRSVITLCFVFFSDVAVCS